MSNWVAALAFSPNGRFLAVGDYSGRVVVCRADTAEPVGPPLPHDDIVMSLAFSPDGDSLAVGTALDWSREPKVTLWRGATGGRPTRLSAQKVEGRVLLLAFSPDCRRLLAGEEGPVFARLWDATDGLR